MKRSAAARLVFATLIAASATARADIDGDSFQREQWGWRVSLTSPKNWIPSEDRSYPSIVLWMVRRDPPGRILLSAEQLDEVADAPAYAKKTAALLEKIGFSVRAPQLHSQTGAYWIDFDNGKVYLRQAFLVVGGIGYVLTLSASSSRVRGQHLRAFDGALRSIKIKRTLETPATEPEDETRDAGPTP